MTALWSRPSPGSPESASGLRPMSGPGAFFQDRSAGFPAQAIRSAARVWRLAGGGARTLVRLLPGPGGHAGKFLEDDAGSAMNRWMCSGGSQGFGLSVHLLACVALSAAAFAGMLVAERAEEQASGIGKLPASLVLRDRTEEPCRGKGAGRRACYECCRAHGLSASRCLRNCRASRS